MQPSQPPFPYNNPPIYSPPMPIYPPQNPTPSPQPFYQPCPQPQYSYGYPASPPIPHPYSQPIFSPIPQPIYSPPIAPPIIAEPMKGPEEHKKTSRKLVQETQKKILDSFKNILVSHGIGMSSPHTIEFNDFTDIVKIFIEQQKIIRISKLAIVYDPSRIYGLITTYKYRKCGSKGLIDQGTITTKHIADGSRKGKLIKMHVFKDDEYIQQIYGKFDNGITRIQIQSNKSTVIDVGSALGQDFSMNIPENKMLVAFAGGIKDSLLNIASYYINTNEN